MSGTADLANASGTPAAQDELTAAAQDGSEPTPRISGQDQPAARHPYRRSVVEWAVTLAAVAVACLLVNTFVMQGFYVPSQSMEPTLFPGDRVFVNKLAHDFHAGDVVVFRRLPADTSTTVGHLIKRVIATSGQKIYVTDCKVYVNGRELAQPYLPKGWQDPSSEYCTTWPGYLPDPYTVPRGDYFVMGDNRRDSDDSRYWGPVPASYMVGRAFLRVWPPSRLGSL
jgi:signal peptidase I